MTTTTYFDGWADAIAEVKKHLDRTPTGVEHCLDCELDKVAFTGIALAANATDTGTVNTTVAAQVVEKMLVTALDGTVDEQVELFRRARTLVGSKPGAATDAIVLLTLLSAKRYERRPDGTGWDHGGTTGPAPSHDHDEPPADLIELGPDHWHDG